ncbi:hypothetical protein T4E_4385 [Trichinella pseudospiralis]|uniref:Uncharacterized protein n=1 Tax=Trichinella pseudospiralis TaxID=6337 RepID=A0A0V0XTQ8_TRIPS|nr:hypothetical protein T4E_4385 [Trichinella pseudospiralis]
MQSDKQTTEIIIPHLNAQLCAFTPIYRYMFVFVYAYVYGSIQQHPNNFDFELRCKLTCDSVRQSAEPAIKSHIRFAVVLNISSTPKDKYIRGKK